MLDTIIIWIGAIAAVLGILSFLKISIEDVTTYAPMIIGTTSILALILFEVFIPGSVLGGDDVISMGIILVLKIIACGIYFLVTTMFFNALITSSCFTRLLLKKLGTTLTYFPFLSSVMLLIVIL